MPQSQLHDWRKAVPFSFFFPTSDIKQAKLKKWKEQHTNILLHRYTQPEPPGAMGLNGSWGNRGGGGMKGGNQNPHGDQLAEEKSQSLDNTEAAEVNGQRLSNVSSAVARRWNSVAVKLHSVCHRDVIVNDKTLHHCFTFLFFLFFSSKRCQRLLREIFSQSLTVEKDNFEAILHNDVHHFNLCCISL